MQIKPDKEENRREFLKSGLRSLSVSGIVFVSGILGWRKISSAESDNLCVIKTPCGNCIKYSECNDEKALEFNQNELSK